MLKGEVVTSISSDAKEAGLEIGRKLKEKLNPKCIFLYLAPSYDILEVISGVKEEIKDIKIIGCTTSSILVKEGVLEGNFVGALALEDDNLSVGIEIKEGSEDARETGREIAESALLNAKKDYAPSYYYLIADKDEEYYMKGIQDVIGDIPCFGGSPEELENQMIFKDDVIIQNGVAVMFIYIDTQIETVYTGAYKESEHVGIITKAEENRLIEIDNESALKKYAGWIGKNPIDLKSSMKEDSILKPLGIKDTLGDLILIRKLDSKEEDILLSNKVVENTAIIQMETTVNGLIDATEKVCEKLNKKIENPACYLFFHSERRKMGIKDRIQEVQIKLKEKTKAPFLLVFTSKEYGYHDHTRNSCGSSMLSFSAFNKDR